MRSIQHIFRLLEPRNRVKLALLTLMQFAASTFEIVGIAIILPFIHVVGDPSILLEHEVTGPLLTSLGWTAPREIILAAGVAIGILFVAKSIFLAVTIRLFYGFLFTQQVDVATRLYEHYLRSPYHMHLRRNSSTMVRNVTQEVNNVVGTILHGVSLPKEVFVSAGLILVLVFTNSVATLIVVGALGAVGFLMASHTGRRLSKKGKVRVEQQARTIQAVNEGVGSITEVKILGRERHFVADLSESSRKLADALLGGVLYQQVPRLFIETIAGLAAVTVVLIPLLSGERLVDILPVLALFGVAFVRLIPSFNRIIQAVNAVSFAAPSIAVIYEEMQHEAGTTPDAGRTAPEGTISVEHVSYAYPGTTERALDDVSLAIEPGQMVSFVGPSGAGKTTLAGILLGLLEPTDGRIRVDGEDLADCLRSYQNQIGYIPQDIFLLDTTIRRNVAFGLSEDEIDDDAVWRALEAAQLAEFIRSLPDGVETLVGERGILVSAGQRQRIGIARALYHDPPMLVLDEATSALDNETERQFSGAIDQLSSKTMIVIAHRLSTIRHSDVIFVLERGRLVGSGDFDTLRRTNGVFRRLLGETTVVPLTARATG